MHTSAQRVPDRRSLNSSTQDVHTDGEITECQNPGLHALQSNKRHPPETKSEQLFSAAKHRFSAEAKEWRWNAVSAEVYKCFPLLAGKKPKDFLMDFPMLRNQVSGERWASPCPVVSAGPMGRVLCHCTWNASQRTATFPHSNSLFHTREMASDSPTCVILAQCPEKQCNLVSMTERQLAKDLLYQAHKLAYKSAPRCPSFPSLLQNTYFAENCYFPPFPHSRGDCCPPREQGLINFLWL